MVEDKVKLALMDIAKLKDKLKSIKRDMREDEKLVADDYVQLKIQTKEMKGQMKDMENEHLEELKSDETYDKLREMRLKAEEDLAHSSEDLFMALSKLPQKSFEMSLETEVGTLRVQVQPEMRVYVNGKEEKKKA